MPTFRHGKNTVVLADSTDLSQYLNSVTASNEVEVPETTTFGSAARSFIVGHKDGSVSFEGLYEGGETVGVDYILHSAIGTGPIMSVSGDGAGVGRRAILLNAKSTSYEVSSPLTEVVAISGEAIADGGLDYGVWLACQSAITTTLTGTSVDNAASTANGGVAHLHITANSNSGTTVAKVQGSANNSTWADLVTFTTVAIGTTATQRSIVSGSVPRYLRALVTPAGAGSLTVSIAFSRR
jgi:hypothetical protein